MYLIGGQGRRQCCTARAWAWIRTRRVQNSARGPRRRAAPTCEAGVVEAAATAAAAAAAGGGDDGAAVPAAATCGCRGALAAETTAAAETAASAAGCGDDGAAAVPAAGTCGFGGASAAAEATAAAPLCRRRSSDSHCCALCDAVPTAAAAPAGRGSCGTRSGYRVPATAAVPPAAPGGCGSRGTRSVLYQP